MTTSDLSTTNAPPIYALERLLVEAMRDGFDGLAVVERASGAVLASVSTFISVVEAEFVVPAAIGWVLTRAPYPWLAAGEVVTTSNYTYGVTNFALCLIRRHWFVIGWVNTVPVEHFGRLCECITELMSAVAAPAPSAEPHKLDNGRTLAELSSWLDESAGAA